MKLRFGLAGWLAFSIFTSSVMGCDWSWLTGKKRTPAPVINAAVIPVSPAVVAPPKPNWDQVRNAKTLADVAAVPLGTGEKQLIEAMAGEKNFSGGRPFELSSFAPLGEMLARGVASFKRDAYVSGQNRLNSGTFDVLRYRITHSDGTESVILTYRQSETPFDVMLGGLDMRPVNVGFYVSDGKGSVDIAF